MKSGYKTTEFWLSVLKGLIPLLPILGILTADEAERLEVLIVEAVIAVVGLITFMQSVINYQKSRTALKLSNGG